jgi:hypothetical protein
MMWPHERAETQIVGSYTSSRKQNKTNLLSKTLNLMNIWFPRKVLALGRAGQREREYNRWVNNGGPLGGH